MHETHVVIIVYLVLMVQYEGSLVQHTPDIYPKCSIVDLAFIMTFLFVFSLPVECEDKNKYCKSWAEAGHCQDYRYKIYMKTECKKSCVFC